jgi:dihydroorotase
LDPLAPGWTITPVLGSASDRVALRAGLRDGVVQAVSVHHSPIDREEQMLPLDQRRPGVAGYQPVLPALWQALVAGDGWQPSELWQALSWGPSAFLGQEPESLQSGTQRWLLFDPEQPHQPRAGSLAANGPLPAQALKGQLLASGLLPAGQWSLDQG